MKEERMSSVLSLMLLVLSSSLASAAVVYIFPIHGELIPFSIVSAAWGIFGYRWAEKTFHKQK